MEKIIHFLVCVRTIQVMFKNLKCKKTQSTRHSLLRVFFAGPRRGIMIIPENPPKNARNVMCRVRRSCLRWMFVFFVLHHKLQAPTSPHSLNGKFMSSPTTPKSGSMIPGKLSTGSGNPLVSLLPALQVAALAVRSSVLVVPSSVEYDQMLPFCTTRSETAEGAEGFALACHGFQNSAFQSTAPGLWLLRAVVEWR